VHRRTVAALGTLVVAAAGACSSSGSSRPVASAGQIVTVVRKAPRTGMGVLDPDSRLDSVYSGVALDSSNTLYYSDELAAQVEKVTPGGTLTRVASPFDTFEGPPTTGLHDAHAIAIDAAGTLYISDEANYVVRAIRPTGQRATIVGSGEPGFDRPVNGPAPEVDLTDVTHLAVDPVSNLYMANGSSIARLGHDNVVHTVADVDEPVGGMAYDGRSNTLYAVDGHRIRRIDAEGTVETVAGTGEAGKAADGSHATQAAFGDLDGLVVDGNGNLFVADRTNNVVQEITSDGVVHTVAGNGRKGFAGDGGSATAAQLNGPGALAIDPAGNLYVADTANQRVRMIGKPGR